MVGESPQHPSFGGPDEDAVLSVVYISTATTPFSELDLALLLAISRGNNQARDLTGLLLFRDGRFMQALEGPEAAVRAALVTIAADPRHTDVRVVTEEIVPARRFGSWAMGYRPMGSGELEAGSDWFGSPEAIEWRTGPGAGAGALLNAFRAGSAA